MGAGVSHDLKLPRWGALIDGIEAALDYKTGNAPEAYRAEQLFQHYKGIRTRELGWEPGDNLNAAIVAGWRNVVAQRLYSEFQNADGTLSVVTYQKKIEEHPYLTKLGKLARDAVLVVTNNFDDALECAVDLDPSVETSEGRRYHSFWRPEPFLRPGMVNIYHPNGYTPLRDGIRRSDDVILNKSRVLPTIWRIAILKRAFSFAAFRR